MKTFTKSAFALALIVSASAPAFAIDNNNAAAVFETRNAQPQIVIGANDGYVAMRGEVGHAATHRSDVTAFDTVYRADSGK